MRRAIAILFLTLSLSACSSSELAGSDVPANGSTATAGDASPIPSTTEEPADADVGEQLMGAWTTKSIQRSDIVDTLTAAGLERAVSVVVRDINTPTSFTLTLAPYGYRVTSGGSVVDHGSLTVSGERLSMTPDCAGCVVEYTYTLSGDQLRLALVSDSSPEYRGLPDEAFQRAIYTSAPFVRE